MELSLDVNLEPLWNWNVKQLFVYIVAEYDQDVTEEELQSALEYKIQYKKDYEKRKKAYLKRQRRQQQVADDEDDEDDFEEQEEHQDEAIDVPPSASLHKNHTRKTSVVLWDHIILKGENSHLKIDNLLNKYALVDIGNHLKNQKLKLSLRWHVTPYLGFMYFGQASTTFDFEMPNKYFSSGNQYNPQQGSNYPYDLDDLVYA